MATYKFILPYTPKKSGKGSPPDTQLRQLRGIGPLFSQRLQDQGFETLQDIYNYLSLPDTTRKVATQKFREICSNPRGGECLDNDSRRFNRSGRRFGNRYRVRSVNLPAYETLIDAARSYYAKRNSKKAKTIKRRIPQRLTPKRRLQRHAFPKDCPRL